MGSAQVGEGTGSVLDHVRIMSAFASHEEIGRFGSRVVVAECEPDVLIAVDVNHDYEAAPIGKDERYVPLELGKGVTVGHGNVASPFLNGLIEQACLDRAIPMQRSVPYHDQEVE